MSAQESIGYLASLLVLATFCMRDMAALRLLAIASNAAFIAYGAMADVRPVLLLHLVLLPLNLVRLAQASRPTLRNPVRCTAKFRARPCRPFKQHGSSVIGMPTHTRGSIDREARVRQHERR